MQNFPQYPNLIKFILLCINWCQEIFWRKKNSREESITGFKILTSLNPQKVSREPEDVWSCCLRLLCPEKANSKIQSWFRKKSWLWSSWLSQTIGTRALISSMIDWLINRLMVSFVDWLIDWWVTCCRWLAQGLWSLQWVCWVGLVASSPPCSEAPEMNWVIENQFSGCQICILNLYKDFEQMCRGYARSTI